MGSDFLFAVPSFWSGVARVIDLGGTFNSYNESRDGATADQRALASDWKMVGKDLKAAMDRFDRERGEPSQLALALDEK